MALQRDHNRRAFQCHCAKKWSSHVAIIVWGSSVVIIVWDFRVLLPVWHSRVVIFVSHSRVGIIIWLFCCCVIVPKWHFRVAKIDWYSSIDIRVCCNTGSVFCLFFFRIYLDSDAISHCPPKPELHKSQCPSTLSVGSIHSQHNWQKLWISFPAPSWHPSLSEHSGRSQ